MNNTATLAIAAAAAMVTAAVTRRRPRQLPGPVTLAPPPGRFLQPRAGAADWDEAYPPLTEGAADLILHEILSEAGFLRICILGDDDPGAVTVLDAVLAFQGNCWDDQGDNGHRQDLIDANRVLGWLGRASRQDLLAAVLELPADDAPAAARWVATVLARKLADVEYPGPPGHHLTVTFALPGFGWECGCGESGSGRLEGGADYAAVRSANYAAARDAAARQWAAHL